MTAESAAVSRRRAWVYIPLTFMALFYLLPMFIMPKKIRNHVSNPIAVVPNNSCMGAR